MMKEEFEELLGEEVDTNDYAEIEHIYTAYNRFPDKQTIVNFWMAYGRKGIDALLAPTRILCEDVKKMREIDRKIQELKEQRAYIQEHVDSSAIVYGFDKHWLWSVGAQKNPHEN